MTWLDNIFARYQGMNEKAISHRPDLANRVHILRTTTSAEEDAPPMQDYSDYADVYEIHTWVRKAIQTLTENVAPLPVLVYREDEPLDNHPVSELLAYHNDQRGPADLWRAWIVHMMLAGESFVQINNSANGQPVELWARRPDQISILPDADRLLYPRIGGYKWSELEDDMVIDAEDMIYWRFHHPQNVWRGIAPIRAVRNSITIDAFSQAWSKSYLKDGGMPSVAVYSEMMTPSEREEYQRKFDLRYQGHQNWHKAIIMEKGVLDVKPISHPPADMQWIEQRKLARDEIGAIFGVPDILMGFGADSYDTEEKRKVAMRTLWTLTLVPLLEHRDDQLTSFFTKMRPMLAPKESIHTDMSDVEWIQRDIAELSDTAKAFYLMRVPFNIINERLGLGFPRFEGDTESFGGSGQQALFPAEERSAEPWVEVKPKLLTASTNGHKAPDYGSIEHRALMLSRDTLTRPQERGMMRQLKRLFQDAQNRVSRRVRELTQLSVEGETKQVPPVGEVFDNSWWEGEFQRGMQPFIQKQFEVSGDAAMHLVLGPDAPFDLYHIRVRESITFITEQQSTKTGNTVFTEMQSLFFEAEQQGLSIPDIMDLIAERFTQYKSDFHTERIARTTMIGSHNAASFQAYNQSGVVFGVEWLASLDSDTRDSHAEAHGQFQPLGGRFQVGASLLLYPGDPAGPPEEIINCRCTTIPKTRA